jgi:hypothetical protein
MTKIVLMRHGHVAGISPERFRGHANRRGPPSGGGYGAPHRGDLDPGCRLRQSAQPLPGDRGDNRETVRSCAKPA